MAYTFRNISKSLALSLALVLVGQIQIAQAASKVEGRVTTSSNATGFFDLRVEVWNRSLPVPQLIQVIDIPRVMVNKGCFQVTVDTGIKGESVQDYSLNILSRGFESWKPFRPAELSSFHST